MGMHFAMVPVWRTCARVALPDTPVEQSTLAVRETAGVEEEEEALREMETLRRVKGRRKERRGSEEPGSREERKAAEAEGAVSVAEMERSEADSWKEHWEERRRRGECSR